MLTAMQQYWTSIFILPKGVVKTVETQLRRFLWKGHNDVGYAKISWAQVYLPMGEGGLGVHDIAALNHVLTCTGHRFLLWHDPWFPDGSLLHKVPRAPSLLGLPNNSPLRAVIREGDWSWPNPIRPPVELLFILHNLPSTHQDEDTIIWGNSKNIFITLQTYKFFIPQVPKVPWSTLLRGRFKIARYSFVLWLAILGRLSTMDKPWLQGLPLRQCILCEAGTVETHDHLFFQCTFSIPCLTILRRNVKMQWPYSEWKRAIMWASVKWREKHFVNMVYRALLYDIVYHVWSERNCRRFMLQKRNPIQVADFVLEEMRQRIISEKLLISLQVASLYKLWRISRR
ncbi:UNVERIFIED_CONTAM: hypothetical protein Sradi_1332300 [Sesamum radiatum]|uniref:Reverse transcriptase zinc-binding domain-containing protein n=1 Tax=Sesamum radiatum TaxID=300843 RepID=A0AAW2UQT0_SESRA